MKKQINLLLPANTSMDVSHVRLSVTLSCKWCVAKETFVAWFYLTTDCFQMIFHCLFTCESSIAFWTSKPWWSLRMLLLYMPLHMMLQWKWDRAVWTFITILCCTTMVLMMIELAFAQFFSTCRTWSWIRYFRHDANLSCFTKIPALWYTQPKLLREMTSSGHVWA